jgi:putative glutamine amidotransferase
VELVAVDITPDMPRATLDGLQALVLSGGSDLGTHPERDSLERMLIDDALRRGLPVFGICRGLQVLNVHLGGSLFEDIPNHRQPHDVAIAPGSRLFNTVGSLTCPVNSRHHQAVDRLAPGLAVTARSADGIIEAIEDTSGRWVFAVQWHPEDLISEAVQLNLFRAFAEALD